MLSEKIRELRRQSGLSQEELADKLNVSRQAVSKWETDAAVPTADKLVELADFFGVSLDFLLREQITETDNRALDAVSQKHTTDAAPKKRPSKRKICGIFLMGAAVFTVIVLIILKLTGSDGNITDSAGFTLNGMGIIVTASIICAVCGSALFISSIK